MPRIPREETAGGIYHIINRGNMRIQVFDDMEDSLVPTLNVGMHTPS